MNPLSRNPGSAPEDTHTEIITIIFQASRSQEGGTQGFTLIFSDTLRTCVDWDHFWEFKILNFNIFGGFQKNKYMLGSEDFVDIFFLGSGGWGEGHLETGLVLGVMSMHLTVIS